jgi:AcrR family transcriptional regulator
MSELRQSSRGGNPQAQRERALGTRMTIVSVARGLFADAGYHFTGTNEIAACAKLTRGALYHHFTDKDDLFAAVFRQVAIELDERAKSAVASLSGDLWPQVTQAFRHYLALVTASAEYRRILLIDGPAVLGWARWRDMQSEFVGQGTANALQMLMDQGLVAPRPTMALASLIQAALHDAALTIAHAAQPSKAAEEATDAFFFLLDGIRHIPVIAQASLNDTECGQALPGLRT